MKTAQELWTNYQALALSHGEWSDEAHAAWEKWAMVTGNLKTANPV